MVGAKKFISSVRGCLLLAGIGGCVSAVQIRINGGLGQAMDAPVAASLVSLAIGMACAWILVAARPAAREALERLRVGRKKWWLFTGGLYGAFYVTVFIVASPVVGIAATAVAVLSGQIAGGLFLDRLRAFHNMPVTPLRLIGAGLALAAVGVSQAGAGSGSWRPGLLVLLCLSGVAMGAQAAVQGKLRMAAGSLWLATAINFTVATLLLLSVLLGTLLFGSTPVGQFPSQWWLYGGGMLGVLVVAISAFTVGTIGVLRLVMALATGQLVGALLLDRLTPIGPGFRFQLLLAAALTIIALWAASTRKISRPDRRAAQEATSS